MTVKSLCHRASSMSHFCLILCVVFPLVSLYLSFFVPIMMKSLRGEEIQPSQKGSED